MSKTPLQVYLDASDHELLQGLAGRLGVSKAEAIRVAIRRAAAEGAAGLDPVLELIGTMDRPGLPADLSTRHDEYAVARYDRLRVAERRPTRRKRK